jgi:hypothetical protein
MSELDQYEITKQTDPLPVLPRGPHSGSTLDAPPRPAAIKAYQAMIRKDLQEQRKGDSRSARQ